MNMQENGDSVPQWAIPTPKLSFLDRVGVAIETCLTKFFTIWGTNCSRYPLPVIIVSVVIAGDLLVEIASFVVVVVVAHAIANIV